MVAFFRCLARVARAALVSNGQHLAISEFQGDQLHRTTLAAHCDLVRRAHLSDMELLAAGFTRDIHTVRRHRHLHSRRRDHPPQVPSPSAAAGAGASGHVSMHSHRGAPRPTLAIVGSESLLGKEVRELLDESSLAVNIKLIAAATAADTSIIAAIRDEPVVINSIELADLGSAEIVVLAGEQE